VTGIACCIKAWEKVTLPGVDQRRIAMEAAKGTDF